MFRLARDADRRETGVARAGVTPRPGPTVDAAGGRPGGDPPDRPRGAGPRIDVEVAGLPHVERPHLALERASQAARRIAADALPGADVVHVSVDAATAELIRVSIEVDGRHYLCARVPAEAAAAADAVRRIRGGDR